MTDRVRSTFRFAAVSALALPLLGGCASNDKADRQAKRDVDRQTMQVEDLTNQRNALLAELERIRGGDAALRAELKATQEQLEQTRIELGRARTELDSAIAAKREADAIKPELAKLRQQLLELQARINAAAPANPQEQREMTPGTPTTQPGNK